MQSQKDSISLTPIGYIRSVFNYKFGTPRQGSLAPHSHASFELEPLWREKGMFDCLEGFSHVWLICHFHQNKHTRMPSKIHPPRLEGKTVGVLASRSPHRPNSIGLTLAKLERVEGDKIFLSGVDLVDGTPVLDIKPYLSDADRPETFSNGWAGELPPLSVECVFSDQAKQDLERYQLEGKILDTTKFKNLVQEVFLLDPRPLAYRERVNERFAVVLGGMDVYARFLNNVFTVESVQPYTQQDRDEFYR